MQMGDHTATITGSRSELYIEPMLTCFGDSDMLVQPNDELAVLSIDEIPQHLPETFENNVRVFEIVNSELTNYVYLREIGQLVKQNHDDDQYVVRISEGKHHYFSKYDFRWLLALATPKTYTHGPAVTVRQTTP